MVKRVRLNRTSGPGPGEKNMELNTTVYVVFAGVVVLFIGGQMRFRAIKGRFRTKGGKLKILYSAGRLATITGGVATALGLFSGFMGPIQLGSVHLPPFEGRFFTHMRSDALAAARKNIRMSGKPFIGWSGKPNGVVEYNVVNNGDRTIGAIVIRIKRQPGTGGGVLERQINGPFLPKKSKLVYPKFPVSAHKMYFSQRTGIRDITIVGASW